MDYGLCYQTAGGPVTEMSPKHPRTSVTLILPYTATESMALSAGKYRVGFCVNGQLTVDNPDYVLGWIQVTN
jgi:hypothetical protein